VAQLVQYGTIPLHPLARGCPPSGIRAAFDPPIEDEGALQLLIDRYG